MGISEEVALTKYGLQNMEETITNTSLNLLVRILGDDSHPLTSRLERYTGATRLAGVFKPAKTNTTKYANSFVQWGLRHLRDHPELYTAKGDTQRKIAAALPRINNEPNTTLTGIPKEPCDLCGGMYGKGLGMTKHSGSKTCSTNQQQLKQRLPTPPN